MLDVGCGAGWFVNSCAHYYDAEAIGLDLNPVVLRQARAVARLMPRCEKVEFREANIFIGLFITYSIPDLTYCL